MLLAVSLVVAVHTNIIVTVCIVTVFRIVIVGGSAEKIAILVETFIVMHFVIEGLGDVGEGTNVSLITADGAFVVFVDLVAFRFDLTALAGADMTCISFLVGPLGHTVVFLYLLAAITEQQVVIVRYV